MFCVLTTTASRAKIWYIVHDCGISWSASLIILVLSCNGLYISKSVLFAEIQIESSE